MFSAPTQISLRLGEDLLSGVPGLVRSLSCRSSRSLNCTCLQLPYTLA